jgi:hypothetical protein
VDLGRVVKKISEGKLEGRRRKMIKIEVVKKDLWETEGSGQRRMGVSN